MLLSFKKTLPDAKIPTHGTPFSAGYDLYAAQVESIEGAPDLIRYNTGIAVEIPSGYFGLLVPRSSSFKTELSLAYSAGILDSDFRGGLSFIYREVRPHARRYYVGDRVGQLVVIKHEFLDFVEVQELSETLRGTKGHGSTG